MRITIRKTAVRSLCGLLVALLASCVCAQVPEHQEAFRAALDSVANGERTAEDAAGKLAGDTSEEHVGFLKEQVLEGSKIMTRARVQLAGGVSEERVGFLKEQALRGGKTMTLALEVLKRMDSAAAIKALVKLANKRRVGPLAVEILADRPDAAAKSALEELAVTPGWHYGRHLALVALLWRGDEETVEKLKSTRRDVSPYFCLGLARWIIEDRLPELETEEQKKQWRVCVMEVTAADAEAANFITVNAGAGRMAGQLHQRREFPFELLRLYVDKGGPSLVAIALMGLQKEQRAVPILEKILERYPEQSRIPVARIARDALASIAKAQVEKDSDE